MSHVFRRPPGLALDLGDLLEPSSVSQPRDAVLRPSRAGCEAPSLAFSGKKIFICRGVAYLGEGPATIPHPAPPLPLTPPKVSPLYALRKGEEKKKITYIFKHCLMVKKNIWRAALPLTQSPPSLHLDTKPNRKSVQKGPISAPSAGAISLGTAATDQGTAGTKQPWRSGWLAKAVLTVGKFLESKGKRAARQHGDPLPVPVPPVLAHFLRAPRKWGCRRNPRFLRACFQ